MNVELHPRSHFNSFKAPCAMNTKQAADDTKVAPESAASDEDADDARLMELSKELRPSREELLKRERASILPDEW